MCYSQLIVMSIEPGDEIGEKYTDSQFIRVEQGSATLVLNGGEEYQLQDDDAVVIPASVFHNVINTGEKILKLYSIYTPPEHKDGVRYMPRR